MDQTDLPAVDAVIVNEIINTGVQIGFPIDAEHVVLIPHRLGVVPPPPPAIPTGVIVVLKDSDPIPTGWALCDGTNGTPDLSDVFRPKDHSVYIQKL